LHLYNMCYVHKKQQHIPYGDASENEKE